VGPRVVVVGAGVVGAACAYHLTQLGARVYLVDQGDVGGGTSSRCDGNVLAIDKNPGYEAQLARRSQEVLSRMAPTLGDIEYRAPGSYLVLDSELEVEPAQRWAQELTESGVPCTFLDRQEVHRRLPDLARDVPGGLYTPVDATLNPLLYVQAMVAWARERGAQVYQRCTVSQLLVKGGQSQGVRLATGDTWEAEAVVVCAGVHTPALLGPLGIDLPIRARKGHLLVSAKGQRFGDVKVMEFGYLMSKFGLSRQVPPEVEAYGVALVYEPTASGNFLLGSSRQFVDVQDSLDVDVAVVRTIVRRALRFYPQMQNATLLRAYSGLRPWTPDHLPVVSPVPGVEGLYVAAGHEGDGIGLAAVTGELVAHMVMHRPPPLSLEPLSLTRFGSAGGEAQHAS
jgi:glycine/D-amino acid oxidase-like deaminating enzyme